MKPYPKYRDSGVEWIGEVPEHWLVEKVKYHLSYQKGKNPKELKPSFSEGSMIYLTMDYLREKSKQIYYVDSPENYLQVDNGEILLLWDGSNAGEFILSKKGVLSSTMAALNIHNVQKIFAWYYLKYYEKYLKESTIGMGIPHVNGEELKNGLITFPSPSEQTTIAAYLDRKTAEIDSLIANKERLIELYEEEKKAVINQAVTKGLDPDAEMKDSGIEWLGEVPAHWEVKKLKYLTRIFRGKFGHRPRNDERLYHGDFPFIQTGEVTNSDKYIEGYKQTLNERGYAVSQEFPAGTLVMTIAANIGDVAILNFDACFPDSIIGFFPSEWIAVDFLYYKFVSARNVLLGMATQNTQQNLNIDRISPLDISYPPVTEQTAIVHHIETQCSHIDAIISKFKKQIDLFKEYRTALISEAVTGKIDVRNEPEQ